MSSASPPLLGVLATPWGLEYSVHECPRRHRDDVGALFPGMDLEGLLVIPTCQPSDTDLVAMGQKVEDEKDRLLERFVEFAKEVCERLAVLGHWADYIDPCSGLPMIHRGTNAVYGEVEAAATLLGYRTQNAGCCKILLHPKWGSSVYPASLFAKAPLEAVAAAIERAVDALREKLC